MVMLQCRVKEQALEGLGMLTLQGRVKERALESSHLPGQQGQRRSCRWASPGQKMPRLCRRLGRQHSWEQGGQVPPWPEQGVLVLSRQEEVGQ